MQKITIEFFDDIKVCENLILDGHHRYISSQLANKTIGNVLTHKTSASKSFEWIDVEFVEVDWDTAGKINNLNKHDAEFNNKAISVLKTNPKQANT